MINYLLLACFGLTQALVFVGLGWWLRTRHMDPLMKVHGDAQAMLDDLNELSAAVAGDVGAHSSALSKINQELNKQGDGQSGPAGAQSSAIGEILAANQQLQEKLAATEARLRRYADQGLSRGEAAPSQPQPERGSQAGTKEPGQPRPAKPREKDEPLSLLILDVAVPSEDVSSPVLDRVLARINKSLVRLCPSTGQLSQFGDEGFTLSLPGTKLPEAEQLAERIRRAVVNINRSAAGSEPEVSVCIGLAQATADEDSGALVRKAKTALLAARKNGDNCTCTFNAGDCQVVPAASVNSDDQAVQSELVEAIHQRLAAGDGSQMANDRRHRQRTPLDSMQLIATCTEHGVPEPDDFYKVRCKDISSGGLAFYMASFPDFQWLVVALGNGPKHVYLRARVMHCRPVRGSDGQKFVVGCQFTARLENCTASDKTARTPTQAQVCTV